MTDFNIVNLNDFTWQLNVALGGGVFAIFSLIYNDYYIFYGLITAFFGVSGHVVYKFFEWLFRKDQMGSSYYWVAHFSNFILLLIWGITLYFVY